MAVLPVPEVVKEMAVRLDGISRNLELRGQQMDAIQSSMLKNEQLKALEGRVSSMEAAFLAMGSELRALLGALNKG